MADVGRRRQAARGTERRGDRAVDEHAPRPRASTATSVAVGHRRSARGRLLLPPPGAEPCRAGGVSEALAPIAVETTPDLGTARAAPACRCQARPAGRPIGADTGSRDRLTHSRGGYAGRGRGSGPLSRRRRAGRRKGSAGSRTAARAGRKIFKRRDNCSWLAPRIGTFGARAPTNRCVRPLGPLVFLFRSLPHAVEPLARST